MDIVRVFCLGGTTWCWGFVAEGKETWAGGHHPDLAAQHVVDVSQKFSGNSLCCPSMQECCKIKEFSLIAYVSPFRHPITMGHPWVAARHLVIQQIPLTMLGSTIYIFHNAFGGKLKWHHLAVIQSLLLQETFAEGGNQKAFCWVSLKLGAMLAGTE